MERKTPKEPFQGEEETKVSYLPLKVTPCYHPDGIGDSFADRSVVWWKRVSGSDITMDRLRGISQRHPCTKGAKHDIELSK